MEYLILSGVIGVVSGYLIAMYFNDKQAVELRNLTTKILTANANAFNAIQKGEDFEIRVTPEGKSTTVIFIRAKTRELHLQGHPPSPKIGPTGRPDDGDATS